MWPPPGQELIFDLYLIGVVGVIFLLVFALWAAPEGDRPVRRRRDDPPGLTVTRRQPEGERIVKRKTKATVMLPAVAAVVSASALRLLLWLGATMFPEGSWAAEVAERTMALGGIDFAWACGIAAGGGIASLMHELRTTPARPTFLGAFGHLTCAQFAGLLVYLLTVQYGLALPLALVACGVAGWGGNRIIVMIEGAAVRRLGLGADDVRRAP